MAPAHSQQVRQHHPVSFFPNLATIEDLVYKAERSRRSAGASEMGLADCSRWRRRFDSAPGHHIPKPGPAIMRSPAALQVRSLAVE
jgi:hypothetical protein